MTDLTIVVEEIVLDIPKTKGKGRPRIGPNDTKITDDPMYHTIFHRENYRNKLSVKVICPLCDRSSTIQKLKRQCSSLCKKNLLYNQLAFPIKLLF